MKQLKKAAVERAMKLQDVMLRAMAKRITWYQGTVVLGMNWRPGLNAASQPVRSRAPAQLLSRLSTQPADE